MHSACRWHVLWYELLFTHSASLDRRGDKRKFMAWLRNFFLAFDIWLESHTHAHKSSQIIATKRQQNPGSGPSASLSVCPGSLLKQSLEPSQSHWNSQYHFGWVFILRHTHASVIHSSKESPCHLPQSSPSFTPFILHIIHNSHAIFSFALETRITHKPLTSSSSSSYEPCSIILNDFSLNVNLTDHHKFMYDKLPVSR